MAALLAKGFRPLFLLAGLFAAGALPAWLLVWTGQLGLGGVLQGMVWHAHEMVFGFTVAVLAGFLLTAVENWTGRPTLRGGALLGVALVWLAARVALLAPGWLGPALDLLFLPLVAVGIARPLLATGNRRNLPFVGLLGLLWLADVATLAGAAGLWPPAAVRAPRAAVYLIAVIILVVPGRVVPMFTRNATGDAQVGRAPGWDRLAIAATAAVAALHAVAWPGAVPVVAGVASVAAFARMRPWFTPGVLSRPLLWVLHLGHAMVAAGLGLLALEPLLGPLGSAPLHAVTAGGIGLLTIGMMARVSLGHTGRPLAVGGLMATAFALVAVAAGLRVIGPWADPAGSTTWLWAASAAWAAGFGLFACRYLPILVAPRADGRPD